jgi:surfactin synthase thioesterase subunit
VADPRLRVVCIPHIGGGGASFNSWVDRLPPYAELCAVRFPGRENRIGEALVDDPIVLLDGLQRALMPALDRPFILLGHCSGSVIAFDLARRLRAAGEAQPAMLIVSSTEAPSMRTIENLHLLPRDELLTRVVEFGGMAKEVLDDADLMTMFERIIRADYRVVELTRYTAQPPLDIPITVIGGRHDEYVDCAALAAWSAETTREFSLHLLDAGHFILSDAAGVVSTVVRNVMESR